MTHTKQYTSSIRSGLFPYPGGKGQHKDRIIERLREQVSLGNIEYREPFLGGGIIAVAISQQAQSSWINDKDISVCAAWNAALNHPQELCYRIAAQRLSKGTVERAKQLIRKTTAMPQSTDGTIDLAMARLIVQYGTHSAIGMAASVRKQVNDNWNPAYMRARIARISSLMAGTDLRDGICTNYDFETVVRDDECRAAIYLDPPYTVAAAGRLYSHLFSYTDHVRLATALRETRHAWVLSYDDSDYIRDFYDFAKIDVLPFRYSMGRRHWIVNELLITPRYSRTFAIAPRVACIEKGVL